MRSGQRSMEPHPSTPAGMRPKFELDLSQNRNRNKRKIKQQNFFNCTKCTALRKLHSPFLDLSLFTQWTKCVLAPAMKWCGACHTDIKSHGWQYAVPFGLIFSNVLSLNIASLLTRVLKPKFDLNNLLYSPRKPSRHDSALYHHYVQIAYIYIQYCENVSQTVT